MTQVLASRRAITMAETIIASLLVGLVMVSTIQIVGPIVRSGTVMGDKVIAANLCNELLEEINSKRFTDPDVDTPDSIGTDSGERPAVRADFDDIDDYNAWSSSPPMLSDNTSMTTLGGWSRSVLVRHVEVDNLSTLSATNTGIKQIIIVVMKDGVEITRQWAIRSQQADSDQIFVKGN